MPPGQSPPYVGICVAFIAILNLTIAASWVSFFPSPSEALKRIPVLCLAAANGVAGFGIWKRRSWARRLEIGLLCLASPPFLVGGYEAFMDFGSYSGGLLALGLGLLSLPGAWCLCQPEAKRWFNEEVQATGREGLGPVAAIVIATILLIGALKNFRYPHI